ncbi:MAG: biopolymer transporter ExbD [Candidatus Latescibacterota bacterium]|nr:MAG: biopolymer transporter ExbD [Candidatus Latescibacterota bacterium]
MKFKKPGQSGNGGLFEVNMTPLIDVSLVLVVMLLLTTPLALESSIMVRKSEQTAAKAEKTNDDDRIELRVMSAEAVRVNRTVVARDDLVDALRPLVSADSNPIVVIGCEDGVSHGAFVDVLDRAKLAGASEIAVTGK